MFDQVKMNADPRRPEKVQRYVPKTNNASGQEDLTPDYMNILGQHQTTANIAVVSDKHAETSVNAEPNLQASTALEEVQPVTDEFAVTTNATNVIPTSPQYGVAIISNSIISDDLPTEIVTPSTETLTDTTAKPSDDAKELHSTPSRNDRFKVVKIASLEPFKRGRWKCMDYVDEAPPAGAARVPQSAGSIQITAGTYMQTQSLPQQQIQQMLLQGGFSNGAQFLTNITPQMMPAGQYFYPQMVNMQNQTLPQQVPTSMPAQFIGNPPYFSTGMVQNSAGFVMPQNFQNVQYVPANMIQNQNSAFVPTSQPVQMSTNFQQSQTYAGQPNVSQSNVQPMVNGHNYNPQNEQQMPSNLPTQSVKSVILNSNNPQSVLSQTQLTQQNIQNHIPVQTNQPVPVIQGQQYQQNTYQQMLPNQHSQSQNSSQTGPNVAHAQPVIPVAQVAPIQSQNFDQNSAGNVYTNPQLAMSVNSLTILDNSDNTTENETNCGVETVSENTDDPAKTNPVVNAIDNKIEQAMDLVKSHLMYTVREEVEVLKEKIAELMERIQQLETENNFLRSQIPKTQNVSSTPAPNLPQTQANTIITNPSPNFISNTTNPLVPPQTSTPVSNTSHPIPITQAHSIPAGEALNQQQ